MLSFARSRAALAAAALVLAACGGDDAKLETTIDPTETAADLAATEAAFNTEATASLEGLGGYIDLAISSAGGVAIAMPSVVAAGPNPTSAPAAFEGVRPYTATGEPMAAIPASLVGEVMVWDISTDQYVTSDLTGAPANGVRFILYAIDELTYQPAEPLVQVGTLDLTQGGTESNPTATLVVRNNAGETVLQYLASASSTTGAVQVEGTAGTGANTATFSLTSSFNFFAEEYTLTWRVSVPARGLSQRVSFGFSFADEESLEFSFNGVLRRGLSKIEIGGTIDFATGGELTVEVGDRLFARIAFNPETEEPTITNRDGQPLTPEEEETLQQVFAVFFGALDASTNLLGPIGSLLGVETGTPLR